MKFPYNWISQITGAEAKRVYDDAQKLLKNIIADGSLVAHGIVGFYPANSVGDDIEIYSDESRSQVLAKLYGLRQQVRGAMIKNSSCMTKICGSIFLEYYPLIQNFLFCI